jgi:creatinine amidohydrolase
MAGRLLRIEELSSTALGDLDKEKTAIFIPISPIEGHGPHLPLGVDFFNAEFFAEKAARISLEKKPDFDAVVCRGIPLGAQLYKQPGSLRIDSGTLYNIMTGVGASLAIWGYRYIFVLSGHGSPRDMVALESACRRISRRFEVRMHNLSGAIAIRFLSGEFTDRISASLSRPLTDEERVLLQKDTHGGWWETSMMLYLKPELVDELYRSLPDTEKGRENPESAYYGSPSRASVEFAEASIEVMTEEAGKVIARCLDGEDVTADTTSPFYRIVFLRPGFKRYLVFSFVFGIIAAAAILIIYSAVFG